MITKTYTASCNEQYLTAAGLDAEKVFYFDIETTGFRPLSSHLYMIGCAHSSGHSGTWYIKQYLAESACEELLLLKLFSEEIRQYDVVITFNGDRFDIPYLKEKCKKYRLNDPFSSIHSVDLYQEIRPYKKLLGLEKMNQKSVEKFMNLKRNDRLAGGVLINVYKGIQDHTSLNADASMRLLFLHNYEDVLGMLQLTRLFAYRLITESTAEVSASVHETDSNCPKVLMASFQSPVQVPVDLHAERTYYTIDVRKSTVFLTVPIFTGTMYHFFPDYKNYCYLPEEDISLHKSVASFVDKAHRQQAKANNCYVKKEGDFLPQVSEFFMPIFRFSNKDKIPWFEYKKDIFDQTEKFSSYIHAFARQSLYDNNTGNN